MGNLKVLVLTPDTDIDRRIILQANSLVKKGYDITIIGVPYTGDNFLSGSVNEKIKIKRVDMNDIEYHSYLVKFYKQTHKKVMDFAYHRNDFINNYANKNISYVDENSSFKNAKKLKNKFVSFITKAINTISTILIRGIQLGANIFYNLALKFMRTFNLNFFPLFDKAFYNAAVDEEADIVIANDLPSFKAGYMIAKERGIPLIYDAHENYTEQCTLPRRYAKLLEKTEAEILPNVDFWIVPNDLLGKAVIDKYQEKYHIAVKEPLVIQNAVKKWEQYPEYTNCNILREKIGVGNDKKILLFQGGFLPKRNLENLVKSMKYVTNSNVVLVMLGFGSYVETLKKIAISNHVEQKVFFLDPVSQDELLKYTCSADVGIIPYPAIDKNTYNCSPNKLYEFIQSRLPILANDLPFLRKLIVGEGIGIVQDFSSAKLIAKAVDEFFNNPEQYQRLKERVNEVAEEINWENEEKKLLEYYTNLQGAMEAAAAKER